MPKRFLFTLLLIINISTFGSIKENLHFKISLEQLNVQITKSYAIRANSINQLTVKLEQNISMKEIYLELSDGTFIELDVKKLKGQTEANWKLSNKHIKTLTFTARTNSIDSNKIEFALVK